MRRLSSLPPTLHFDQSAPTRILLASEPGVPLGDRVALESLLQRAAYAIELCVLDDSLVAVAEKCQPDVLLLYLPVDNGTVNSEHRFRWLAKLKDSAPVRGIPVIVVSDAGVESDIVYALEHGAVDYILRSVADALLLVRIAIVARSGREKEALWRLAEDLRRAQSELAQARRNAALGRLAAGIAHEINNPAAVVVTDLHEIGELAGEIDAGGDPDRAFALASIASEALEGMARIRDVVRDVSIFASVADEQSTISLQRPIDLLHIVTSRAARHGGRTPIAIRALAAEPILVVLQAGGSDELEALIGLLLRSAGESDDVRGSRAIDMKIERVEELVVLSVTNPAAESKPAYGDKPRDDRWEPAVGLHAAIAQELAARLGGEVRVETSPSGAVVHQLTLPATRDLAQEQVDNPGGHGNDGELEAI